MTPTLVYCGGRPVFGSLRKLGWSAVRSIGMVYSRTIRDGKTCEESRKF